MTSDMKVLGRAFNPQIITAHDDFSEGEVMVCSASEEDEA
jgi:hypothetical protein